MQPSNRLFEFILCCSLLLPSQVSHVSHFLLLMKQLNQQSLFVREQIWAEAELKSNHGPKHNYAHFLK